MSRKWITNGEIDKLVDEGCCPDGFRFGRKPVSDETRKKHSINNGIHKLTEEQKILRAEKISRTKNARTKEEILEETNKAKQTFLEHFGVEHPMKTAQIKEKLKESFIAKYGVDNPAKNEYIKEKIKETNLEKYGTENVFAAEEIKERIKETNIIKYGVDNYQKTEEARERARKYYKINKEFILKKIKQSKLDKYGNENFNNIEKSIQTCLDKYGTEYYSQTNSFHKHHKSHFEISDQYFDSLPELAVYLYAIANEIDIERTPTRFEYEFENKTHYYFPDFKYNGKLVEIKGDHFFKENKMINPFDPSQNDLYEAKHQCGLKNGVEFWRTDDYQFAIGWFKSQGFKKEDFINDQNKY